MTKTTITTTFSVNKLIISVLISVLITRIVPTSALCNYCNLCLYMVYSFTVKLFMYIIVTTSAVSTTDYYYYYYYYNYYYYTLLCFYATKPCRSGAKRMAFLFRFVIVTLSVSVFVVSFCLLL